MKCIHGTCMLVILYLLKVKEKEVLLLDVDINCYMSRHDQTAQLSYCIKLEKQVGE